MSWIAYVDESMRQRPGDDGIYVLAAATLDDADADSIRQKLIELAPTRRRRVHWRDATVSERRKMVAAIAELHVLHFVVVGTRLKPRAQERGRRLCLRRLLWELGTAGIGHVWLESRTASLNATDYAAVEAWRAQHAVPGRLHVDFARPFGPGGDQLLWLPDVVAGAVATARGDGDDQYLAALEPLVTEMSIRLD